MAQSFPTISPTDLISASRPKILERDDAVKSNFSGTAFPSTDLVVGQTCYRTDLQKFYVLEKDAPTIWRELTLAINLGNAAGATIGTAGDTVPKNNTANTWSLLQTFLQGIAIAGQIISGSSGSIQMDTDVRLNAAAGKLINFMIANSSKMSVAADGGITIGGVTGGSKGGGSLNAVTIYQNGTALGPAAFMDVGAAAGKLLSFDNVGNAAFRTIGTGAEQVPLNSQLGPYASLQPNNQPTYYVGGDGQLHDLSSILNQTVTPGSITRAFFQSGNYNGTGYAVLGNIRCPFNGSIRVNGGIGKTSSSYWAYWVVNLLKFSDGTETAVASGQVNPGATVGYYDFNTPIEKGDVLRFYVRVSNANISAAINGGVLTNELPLDFYPGI